MTFEELKSALIKAGIVPGCDKLDHAKYVQFIDGLPVDMQTFAMDCFTPDGKPIEPGYEESLDTYWFWPTSWEVLGDEYDDWRERELLTREWYMAEDETRESLAEYLLSRVKK
jgi:hypothetical protein